MLVSSEMLLEESSFIENRLQLLNLNVEPIPAVHSCQLCELLLKVPLNVTLHFLFVKTTVTCMTQFNI